MKENWMPHDTLLQKMLLSYGNGNHFGWKKWINLENALEKRTEKKEKTIKWTKENMFLIHDVENWINE